MNRVQLQGSKKLSHRRFSFSILPSLEPRIRFGQHAKHSAPNPKLNVYIKRA